MKNFTFISENQVFGNNRLEIIKKYGVQCAVTDMAVLLGADVNDNEFVEEKNSKKYRAGNWWLKSAYGTNVGTISYFGEYSFSSPNDAFIGARPACAFSKIDSTQLKKRKTKNKILEVEYGEYPQMVESIEISKILEKKYKESMLNVTGKMFCFKFYETNYKTKIKKYEEYEYNGNKYIRFVGNDICIDEYLSDGRSIKIDEPYWIKVEPIIWMVDEKADIAISKKIIFSGVRYDHLNHYAGKFDITEIKKYLDSYFATDIIPTEKIDNSLLANKKVVNPYGFSFNKVSEEQIIMGAIESDIAVLLHGKSSEGKSARVKQIDPNCVIIYLRNATPESLNGKNVYNSQTGELIDVKPTWLRKLEERCEKEPEKIHIVFFDEITNALPSIQGIAFNIILDKEVNGIWKLPENARIVASCNDITDSLAANRLAEPLFNRFAHVYINTTVDDWLKWANENHIHPAVYAFISYRKGAALRTDYNGEVPNADPRKWEMASKMLYETRKPEMIRALVGEEITTEFVNFCKQKVLTLEDVLNRNYTNKNLAMNVSEKYATVVGLTQVTEENLQMVREFVSLLGAEFSALFDLLWVNNDENRLEILAEQKLIRKKGGR